jgi:uncharacterized membrane protein YebE (DUF533 family)
MKTLIITGAALAMLSASACTSTGNTERGALGGAALGAAAGAIIGNNVGRGDAATGAAIGAAVGGVGGAAYGANKDKQPTAQGPERGPNGEEMLFDRNANRYYYIDRRSGRSYWANGEYRG